MRIVLRKLSNDTHGPDIEAVCSEQELIAEGYVWDFSVINDSGLWVRTGYSKIETEAEIRAYIVSGMNRMEWEAMHA